MFVPKGPGGLETGPIFQTKLQVHKLACHQTCVQVQRMLTPQSHMSCMPWTMYVMYVMYVRRSVCQCIGSINVWLLCMYVCMSVWMYVVCMFVCQCMSLRNFEQCLLKHTPWSLKLKMGPRVKTFELDTILKLKSRWVCSKGPVQNFLECMHACHECMYVYMFVCLFVSLSVCFWMPVEIKMEWLFVTFVTLTNTMQVLKSPRHEKQLPFLVGHCLVLGCPVLELDSTV